MGSRGDNARIEGLPGHQQTCIYVTVWPFHQQRMPCHSTKHRICESPLLRTPWENLSTDQSSTAVLLNTRVTPLVCNRSLQQVPRGLVVVTALRGLEEGGV